MKKSIILFVILGILISFCACSGMDTDSSKSEPSATGDSSKTVQTEDAEKVSATVTVQTEDTEKVSATVKPVAGFEDKITAVVKKSAFTELDGDHFVVIIAEITHTAAFADEDSPALKADYANCKDLTNNTEKRAEQSSRSVLTSVGKKAFENNFNLCNASFLSDNSLVNTGGFAGEVDAGCKKAVLQLCVQISGEYVVFAEVELTKS